MLRLTLAMMGMVWMQAAATQRKAAPQAEKEAVCEVARSADKYAGQYLEITGDVAGVDPQHLLLTSSECMLGVKLAFAPEVQAQDDVRIFFAALRQTLSGRTESGISGTFEGVYVYSKDGRVAELQVEGIDHLQFPKR